MEQGIIFIVHPHSVGAQRPTEQEIKDALIKVQPITIDEKVLIQHLDNSLFKESEKYIDNMPDYSTIIIDKGITLSYELIDKLNTHTKRKLYQWTSENTLKKLLTSSIDVLYNDIYSYYADGVESERLSQKCQELGVDFSDFLDRLRENEINENGRLSEKLKKVVASRDEKECSRTQMALELKTTVKTIQRACTKYGVPLKAINYVEEDSIYEEVEGIINETKEGVLVCPKCRKQTNPVSSVTNERSFYCKHCSEEYKYQGNKVLRVKWENIN